VIENGVDTAFFAGAAGEDSCPRRSLVYVGSMDYHANIDAVLHFADQMWPAIHGAYPELAFKIVGRRPPESVRALAARPQIEVTGRVDDIRPYYREALAAVVPLRVGGGTRLKILEAMAASTPVISTRLGAEGLAVKDGDNILLAEGTGEFVAAVGRLCNPELRSRLIEKGLALVRSRYDWAAIGDKLFEQHRRLA
jgi:glycosyltransferase involved in cell wall biosynthesis